METMSILFISRPILNYCQSASTNSAKTEEKVEANSNEQPVVDKDAFEKLVNENKKLTKSLADIDDKYKRALAESENVRRRMAKQVEDAKVFGIQSFCKDLLEVSDILAKATEAVPHDALDKKDSFLNALHDGVQMTNEQLLKVFEKHHLLRIYPKEGEKFDPNFHEALFQTPLADGKTANTISAVTKIGFKLHNRVLRPAFVGVYCK